MARVRYQGVAALAAGMLLVLSTATARAADPPDQAKLVEGMESMAPVPSNAELNSLAAKYPKRQPVVEGQGDQAALAAAVTVHQVYVMAAADEEYRAYYGQTGWQPFAENVIEYADDELYNQFGINYNVRAYANWDSAPDTSRAVCNLLSELRGEVSSGAQDVIAGFSKNATSGSKGCHAGNDTIVLWHGDPTSSGERFAEWTVQQHESSHDFGAPDRYPDPNGLHPNDVMEDQYHFYNIWCTKAGYNDKGIVASHAGKYR